MTTEHNLCKNCSKELEPKLSHYEKYKETYRRYRDNEETKQKFAQYRKEYRQKDPQKTKEYDALNYAKKREDKIDCECGRKVMRIQLKKHLATKYHMNHIKTNDA
jgi:hypothetical protein